MYKSICVYIIIADVNSIYSITFPLRLCQADSTAFVTEIVLSHSFSCNGQQRSSSYMLRVPLNCSHTALYVRTFIHTCMYVQLPGRIEKNQWHRFHRHARTHSSSRPTIVGDSKCSTHTLNSIHMIRDLHATVCKFNLHKPSVKLF